MASIPKAVLYYSPVSVWSAVARLAIEEKGYGSDEIDYRIVDLDKGENYDPAFLRLNPNATVPTLIVPYENCLIEGVESRYKALTDTKTIVEFLDKSRSAISRTQTTSMAPAPALMPATIAASTTSKIIVEEILHCEMANPNRLIFESAGDDKALLKLAEARLVSFKQREKQLTNYLSEAEEGKIRVSEKVKKLWKEKLEGIKVNLEVLIDAEKGTDRLDEEGRKKRDAYFERGRQAWERNMREVLTRLNQEMVGPFALGDQLSVADLHLAGWLTRVVRVAGGSGGDDGDAVVKMLEARVGAGFKLEREYVSEVGRRENGKTEKEAKIGVFWDAIRERASWRNVYGNGVF